MSKITLAIKLANDYQMHYNKQKGYKMKNITLAFLAILAVSAPAMATTEYLITIKDHKFTPANLDVPANTKFKLIVDNQDPTPEEFESHDFHREKIIKGNSKATILVGPLKAGVYKYFGEFNEKTAQGTITVK